MSPRPRASTGLPSRVMLPAPPGGRPPGSPGKSSLARQLRHEVLETYLRDNVRARRMRADGSYQRLTPGSEPPVDSQALLLARHPGTAGRDD